MDPLRYCRDKAAPDGSTGYYTVLFQPPRHHNALLALLALERELQEVVEECSEPAVAHHKLAFWREQFANLLAGEASHPVCVAMLRSSASTTDAGVLAKLLRGVAERINLAQIPNLAALDASCRATAGVVGECMAGIIAPGDANVAERNALAGAAVERVRLLRLPRRAGRPPHAGVPLELLTRSGATPSQVDARGNGEALQALRRELLENARDTVTAARTALPSTRGLAATRLRLGLSEAKKLLSSGYVSDGSAARPLPLSLLWSAWRSRPREID